MDEVQQRFVGKYFFLKGWGNKKITAELQTTFHDSALSSSTVGMHFQAPELSQDIFAFLLQL
jgi:hypothetical protein